MTCSQGVFAKLLMEPGESAYTWDSASEIYEFLFEDMSRYARIVGDMGIRGTRSRHAIRTRFATNYVFGRIVMQPSPEMLDTLLPKIIGSNESPTDTFNMTETVPYFGILIDRDYDTFEYQDCKVNKATIRSRAPQLGEEGEPDVLQLILEIIAKKEVQSTAWPSPAPSLSTGGGATSPLVFSDADPNATPAGSVSLVSAEREIKAFEITINNHLRPRFVNSVWATDICETDRTVDVKMVAPWETANSALYDQALAGTAATLKFAYNLGSGVVSTQFDFGTLQVPARSPTVTGKREVDLILEGRARQSGSTLELVVTNDATA